MRKSVVALATVLALAASGLVGCSMLSSPLDDANKAINAANVHLNRFQASSGTVQKLASDLEQLKEPKKDAVAALQIIDKLKAEMDVQKGELTQAAADLARVKKLDVDAKYKKYADLEIAVTTAERAVVDEASVLYSEMERMYVAIRDDKATTSVTTNIMSAVDKSSAKIGELTDAASKAKDAADAYFNKMGSSK